MSTHFHLRILPCLLAISALSVLFSQPLRASDQVLIIRGSDGTDAYREIFDDEVTEWQNAATRGLAKFDLLRTTAELKTRLNGEALKKSAGTLWLVLIGHGTFDGRETRFNLEGPDFTSAELAEWVKPIATEVVIINGASASGAFVKPLSGPKRIIVAATKSGDEVFYPRFGEHFAKAINGNLEADLDQDHQVSILEAFIYANKQAVRFYETEGRISTEHAIVEDNGDGIGTRSENFEGAHPKDSKFDGERAHQLALALNEEELKLSPEVRAKRDNLELQVRDLTRKRSTMKEEDFLQQVEALFRQIAQLTATKTGGTSAP